MNKIVRCQKLLIEICFKGIHELKNIIQFLADVKLLLVLIKMNDRLEAVNQLIVRLGG